MKTRAIFKDLRSSIILLGLVLNYQLLPAQDKCKDILEKGIYDNYSSTSSNSLQSNVNEFFSLTETKRQEYANNSNAEIFAKGSWQGQYGLFRALYDQSKSTTSNTEIFEKTQQEYGKNGRLSASSYSSVVSTIVNVDVINAWSECMKFGHEKFSPSIIGDESSQFILSVNYPVVSITDAPITVIGLTFNNVVATGDVNICKGSIIYPISGAAQSFIRIDKTKTASIVINLSGRQPLEVKLDPIKAPIDYRPDIEANMPVGTIISSILPFESFRQVMSDVGDWTPTSSKWVPADGREIWGSKLHKETKIKKVPDLRGQFLRGLNKFSDDLDSRSDEFKDPDGDNRKPGDPQTDAILNHTHSIDRGFKGDANYVAGGSIENSGFLSLRSGTVQEDIIGEPNNIDKKKLSSETRPKNVAIFYYIKIN